MSELTGELVVISGRYRGHRIPLAEDGLRIGRDRSCAVAVDDEAASRIHSEIFRREGQFVLRDLQSTNGTFLNDARVSESPLQNGDRIGVGETVLLLQLEKSTDTLAPQVVFSKDPKKPDTRFSVSLQDIHIADLDGGAASTTQLHFTQLYEFMVDVAGILHPPALLDRSLEHFVRALKADRGLVLLLNPDGSPGLKATRASSGASNQNITISQILAQQLVHKKESILILSGKEKQTAGVPAEGVLSSIGAPLKVKDKVIGLVYFESLTIGAREFSELDLKLCAAMSQQLAICVENTRLYTELLDAAEFNNSVLRSLGSGILVADRSGRIIRMNLATQEILGFSELALIGHSLSEIPGLGDLHRVIQNTLTTGLAEDRCEATVQVGIKTGSPMFVPLGISTSVLSDHAGRIVGAVANFRNLSAIRKLQEQVRRSQHMAALGQMAASVAHEVRNPLNTIRGLTQLLQEMPGGNESTRGEYSKIIIEEVDRMNRIVQDLLDFSRQRELTLHPVDLDKTLNELLRDMRGDADRCNAAIELAATPPGLPNVLGDADKLRQVFRNILLNALQACEKDGRIKIEMSARTSTAESQADDAKKGSAPVLGKRQVAIAISDNGSGIDPAVLPRIFEPFFTQKESGTGLGLSISQKIAEQHSGRIEVASELGKGSTFTVILPAI